MPQILTFVQEVCVDIIEGDGYHHSHSIDMRNQQYRNAGFQVDMPSGQIKLPPNWNTKKIGKEELRWILANKGKAEATLAQYTYEILCSDYLTCTRGIYYAGVGLLELLTRYSIKLEGNEAAIIYDRMTGKEIKIEEDSLLKSAKKAEDYLAEHYPDWKNPLAYWG